MSLLEAHLEQIKISCQGIDTLPFPPPKIFTNALLSRHDITSLIRDTESHERALFSVPAPTPPAPQPAAEDESRSRRRTIFNVSSGEVTTGPPRRAGQARSTAVAAVLGGETYEKIRTGGVDVDVLLRGAEKLCGVYEVPGARERIGALRARWRDAGGTLAYYEAKVAEQGEQLAALNGGWMGQEEDEQGEDGGEVWTEEDLRREEEEIRVMEGRRRELQERLRSMEKDLGGLSM